jgi:hypothetical protein
MMYFAVELVVIHDIWQERDDFLFGISVRIESALSGATP